MRKKSPQGRMIPQFETRGLCQVWIALHVRKSLKRLLRLWKVLTKQKSYLQQKNWLSILTIAS
ncbi:hypothetical protein VDIAB_270450 [Vibrio diabolicus]|nr:hypothetical protein VDIAB_270450 [Vibrio diabolicus]